MNNESNFAIRVRQYIGALGMGGQILTGLGLLAAMVDIVASLVGRDLGIPPLLVVLWITFVLVWANFRIFEAQRISGVEFRMKEHKTKLVKWLYFDGRSISLQPELTMTLQINVSLYNHDLRPTHIKMTVVSIDSDWIPAKASSDFEVKVDRTISRGTVKSGNPFSLVAGEINDDVRISTELMFRVPDRENGFEYLGELSRLSVILSAEQAGRKVIHLPFECDVKAIHRSIEEELMVKLQHVQQGSDIPRQLFPALKQYWNVHERVD